MCIRDSPKTGNYVNIGIALLVAVFYLSEEWLPMGPQRGLSVNVLFVAGCVAKMCIRDRLRADQIDLKKTSSIGVAGLKYFLEYAGKGTGVLNHSYAAVAEEVGITFY